MNLVLSLFPGIGMLDMAFERVGFCVVRGPDVLWGGDIRRFHPPAGRFDGIIGGPPCQAFSSLAHMVRHNGHEPKFGNLIPEFERCVAEAQPQWFVMENVPAAPQPVVDGYGVHSFVLNNRQFGESQNRKRRISFGWRGDRRVLMLDVVAIESPDFCYAATGAASQNQRNQFKKKTLHNGKVKADALTSGTNRSAKGFAAVKRLQGLPDDFDLPGLTIAGKVQAVANGVPLAMGTALARGVAELIGMPILAPGRDATD